MGVSLEHGLGNDLEELLLRPHGWGLAFSDCGKYFGGMRPRLGDVRIGCIADYSPDTLAAMLALDEKAFPALGQDPHAKAHDIILQCFEGNRQRQTKRPGDRLVTAGA